MKKLLHSLSDGSVEVVDVPSPNVQPGSLLIDTTVSLISAGTERMLIDFGRSNLIAKAKSQPDKVRQVLNKVGTDGFLVTLDAVRSKLSEPISLGYSNVGVVRVSNVPGFLPGDRVVSNGQHAETVCVPENLCAKIPEEVDDASASFTVVASIGLQAIRLAKPVLGELFVVTGVGLIGLLTVQMLRAAGCRVLAIDHDPEKLKLASDFGATICDLSIGQDPVAVGLEFSKGRGVDGVIIAASTSSNETVSHAAKMCRKRGRIVLAGVAGLDLKRSDFYEKELTFQVSCSYGPGRYDPAYEEGGRDYPYAFVRWTAQRNFEAVLDMLASGALNVQPLITERILFDDASRAYEILRTQTGALGVILNYDSPIYDRQKQNVELTCKTKTADKHVVMGFLGAGNYASRILIPAFKSSGAILHSIASSGGTTAFVHGRRAGFANATSNAEEVIGDPEINAVAVVTRHNSHAALTEKALNAGKHVFVEKPLSLDREGLERIKAAHATSERHLMVGFNRRFAPQVQTMKKLLDGIKAPKSFIMLMNAGSIPEDHWTQDPMVGGGRIIGEACHYIDLMRFLAGSPIRSVQALRMGPNASYEVLEDKASITLGFEDGSFGTIHYLANGPSSFPKERIEVFVAGRSLHLDNFLKLRGLNWPTFNRHNLWRQDKGQRACVAAFVNAVHRTGEPPIQVDELFEVSHAALDVVEILRTQK